MISPATVVPLRIPFGRGDAPGSMAVRLVRVAWLFGALVLALAANPKPQGKGELVKRKQRAWQLPARAANSAVGSARHQRQVPAAGPARDVPGALQQARALPHRPHRLRRRIGARP
jgi:hypothetical protein